MAAGAGFGKGVWAGGAALAVLGIARWAHVAPFPPELLALRLFELLPAASIERFLIALGPSTTGALFVATHLVCLLGAGLAGILLPRLFPFKRPLVRVMGYGGLLTLSAFLLVFPLLRLDPWGKALPYRLLAPAPVGVFLGAIVFGLVLEGPKVSIWVVRRGRRK